MEAEEIAAKEGTSAIDNITIQAALKDAQAGHYGPRVMLSSGIGIATRYLTDKEQVVGVLVRDDGWRLAFRRDTEGLARAAWRDQWIGLVRRQKDGTWIAEQFHSCHSNQKG